MQQGGFQQEQVATDPAEEYLRAHLNRAARAQQNTGVPLPPIPQVD